MSERSYFIVWNGDRTEGFITDDEDDAKSAVSGKPHRKLGFPTQSTAGAAFHDTYEDQPLKMQRVRQDALAVNKSSSAAAQPPPL